MKIDWRYLLGIIFCASLIALGAMWFRVEVEKQPICSMDMVFDADVNIGNDLIQNMRFHEIKVTAPCGNEGFNLMDSLLRK